MSRCHNVLLAGTVLVGLCGCHRGSSTPPASPEKPKNEADLALVAISSQAYKSLGIETQSINTAPVQEHLALTGWIMAKQGNEVTLTAPVSGYVRMSPKMKRCPQAGERATAEQEVFAIEPVLSPNEQITNGALRRSVEGELTKARDSVAAAKKELERVRILNQPKEKDQKPLRTDQELEQAELKFKLADEDLKAAKDKLKLFEMPERPIQSPRAGTIVMVHVSPGQYVAAASPLITIVDLTQVWVRVPVPEFDLPQVNASQPVTLKLKGNGDNGAGKAWASYFRAKPVALVPQVDPLRHTADLLYEASPYSLASERDGAVVLTAAAGSPLGTFACLCGERTPFAKDQMVTVFVPLGQKRTESVVPYSAIIYDAFGGAWIYLERTADKGKDHRFERRRVELGPTVNGGVIIRPTTSAAERVVVIGAASLYSREFHSPPVPAGHKQKVDDDD